MKLSLIWERTPTSLGKWLKICGLVLSFATAGLILVYADTLCRAIACLSCWPLGAVQGVIAGLHDAVGNPQRFVLSGSAPTERLVSDLKAWGWWPPTMDYYANHPDEMQRLPAHHLFLADELDRSGARAGIGFWVWAMSDGAVRTVSASFVAVAFTTLAKIVIDSWISAFRPAGGASISANPKQEPR